MSRPHRPRRVTVTRWEMPDGTRVPAGTAGARKVTVKTASWYFIYRRKHIPLNTTDEGEAWVRMRARLAELQAGRTAPADLERRPLAELLTEYCQTLADKGDGEDHVATVRARLTLLLRLAGWKTARDISDDTLLRGLARAQQDETDQAGAVIRKGIGARTRNHYRTHARAFCGWLGDRLGRQLLSRGRSRVPLASVDADPRHPRRCPSTEEVEALFHVLDGGPVTIPTKWTKLPFPGRCGMSSRQRAMGYRVSMGTGLRADELRSLTRESFDLDAGVCHLSGAAAKNRKAADIPLPPWLSAELRQWFADGGGTWSGFPAYHPGRLLVDDLKLAGVEYRTRTGFLDFHSLRVWYLTNVGSNPNIDPKTLQVLGRHSSPTTTLEFYVKMRTEKARQIADQVPRPGGAASPSEGCT